MSYETSRHLAARLDSGRAAVGERQLDTPRVIADVLHFANRSRLDPYAVLEEARALFERDFEQDVEPLVTRQPWEVKP